MVPRFTDATIAVPVRGLRGVIAAAAAAGCAAAAKAPETWRGCDMAATRTPVIEFEIVMIAATLLSSVWMILRLSLAAESHKRFCDLRFWLDFYEDWRPFTRASTSAPNCSSLRAPMPGIETRADSSAGNVSAMAISVLSVNTT